MFADSISLASVSLKIIADIRTMMKYVKMEDVIHILVAKDIPEVASFFKNIKGASSVPIANLNM